MSTVKTPIAALILAALGFTHATAGEIIIMDGLNTEPRGVEMLYPGPNPNTPYGVTIPFPDEFTGFDAVEMTVYFVVEDPIFSRVGLVAEVDSWNVDDDYPGGGTPTTIPGVPENYLLEPPFNPEQIFRQTFLISPLPTGELLRVALKRALSDNSQRTVWLIAAKLSTDIVTESPEVGTASTQDDHGLVVRPNPFGRDIAVDYSIDRVADVTLRVFDVQGRLVDTIVRGRQIPGAYSFVWDGQNASSGVFFFELDLGGVKSNSKAVKLR